MPDTDMTVNKATMPRDRVKIMRLNNILMQDILGQLKCVGGSLSSQCIWSFHQYTDSLSTLRMGSRYSGVRVQV